MYNFLKNIKRKHKIALIIVLALMLVFIGLNWAFPLPKNIQYSKTITDKDGNILHAFLTPTDKWRMYTELNEISLELKKAIVYKEDKYFYYHFGINPIAITRALFNNIVNGKRTSGASTITMQVARLLEPKQRTYLNKIKEVFRALQLEFTYSKNEILQLYLNLVPYGGNIEGVKSAAVLYFNKAPNHLSIAEITTLAIIPNRPSSLKLGNNNDYIVQERDKWLNRFKDNGVFTEQEINDALTEPLTAKRLSAPKAAPHFSYRMRFAYPQKAVIKTHLNSDFQAIIENQVNDYRRTLKTQNINNVAVMVIENNTNHVISYVGSANFYDETDAGQVDGIKAIRQPGSTLKPLVYATAFDMGIYTPKTVITDVPVNFNGYAPVNYNLSYNGYVSIEKALAQSLNIPAVKALEKTGTDAIISKLIKAQFNTIKKQASQLGLSLVLGGCGVSLQELTALYSAFANHGVYRNLVWLQNESVTYTDTLLSENATYMLTDILTQLERPDLPRAWQNAKNLPQVAWKTGTSYGRKDAWSIGYNANYTIGVWVGNFSGEGVPDLTGASKATPLLFNIFNAIDQSKNSAWFTKPTSLPFRLVCSETGLPFGEYCTDKQFDYYIPLVSNNVKCQHILTVPISENDSISYCKHCQPNAGFKIDTFKNHPTEILAYFNNNFIAYNKIPPHNSNCERILKTGKPTITSPINKTSYYIDKTEPEPLMLSCNAQNQVKTVHWYINDVFFKSAEKTETVFFIPEEGQTKISCSDDLGRNTNITIEVKYIDF